MGKVWSRWGEEVFIKRINCLWNGVLLVCRCLWGCVCVGDMLYLFVGFCDFLCCGGVGGGGFGLRCGEGESVVVER